MTEPERQRWMLILGYSPAWYELGMLTDDVLQAQAVAWQAPGADRNPEHYRFGAWRSFFETLEALPATLVMALLALDLQEAGLGGTAVSSFGHGIAYALIGHEALTTEGLALLRRHPIPAPSFARLLAGAEARLAHTSTG